MKEGRQINASVVPSHHRVFACDKVAVYAGWQRIRVAASDKKCRWRDQMRQS